MISQISLFPRTIHAFLSEDLLYNACNKCMRFSYNVVETTRLRKIEKVVLAFLNQEVFFQALRFSPPRFSRNSSLLLRVALSSQNQLPTRLEMSAHKFTPFSHNLVHCFKFRAVKRALFDLDAVKSEFLYLVWVNIGSWKISFRL